MRVSLATFFTFSANLFAFFFFYCNARHITIFGIVSACLLFQGAVNISRDAGEKSSYAERLW